jgi:hypothetical protein
MIKFNKGDRKVLFNAKCTLSAVKKKFDAAGKPSDTGTERTVLEGRPIIYNALSSDRGGFKVQFLPGSANFVTPTFGLFHHDYKIVLGCSANGTLRLYPDNDGVSVEIDPPETGAATDVVVLVRDKYVTAMSFSMLFDDVLKYEIVKSDNDDETMIVSAFSCDEVTITPIPSFIETTIGVQAGDSQSATTPLNMSAAPERIAQAMKLEQLRLNSISL